MNIDPLRKFGADSADLCISQLDGPDGSLVVSATIAKGQELETDAQGNIIDLEVLLCQDAIGIILGFYSLSFGTGNIEPGNECAKMARCLLVLCSQYQNDKIIFNINGNVFNSYYEEFCKYADTMNQKNLIKQITYFALGMIKQMVREDYEVEDIYIMLWKFFHHLSHDLATVQNIHFNN